MPCRTAGEGKQQAWPSVVESDVITGSEFALEEWGLSIGNSCLPGPSPPLLFLFSLETGSNYAVQDSLELVSLLLRPLEY